MRLALAFAAALLCLGVGCSKKSDAEASAKAPTTDAERDVAFWRWVKGELGELMQIKSGKEPIVGELARRLEAVDPRLAFELGVGKGEFELIVSADGDRAAFPVVERLVKAAPSIDGLKVVAFRPRKGPGMQLQLGDRKLTFDDLWFEAADDAKRPGLIALTVYVKDLAPDKVKPTFDAVLVMLDVALGERDVELKVGTIDVKAAPAELAAPLKPFKALAETVDAWGKG